MHLLHLASGYHPNPIRSVRWIGFQEVKGCRRAAGECSSAPGEEASRSSEQRLLGLLPSAIQTKDSENRQFVSIPLGLLP